MENDEDQAVARTLSREIADMRADYLNTPNDLDANDAPTRGVFLITD